MVNYLSQPMAQQNLTEKLFDTIFQLRKLTSQVVYKSHEEKIATMLQFSALIFLKGQSGVTLGDLAEYLQISKSSATQLTERLVKTGAVKKINDTQDKRVVHLAITTKGDNELTALKKKTMAKMKRFLSKIPQEDIKELIRIQIKLIESIKKEIS